MRWRTAGRLLRRRRRRRAARRARAARGPRRAASGMGGPWVRLLPPSALQEAFQTTPVRAKGAPAGAPLGGNDDGLAQAARQPLTGKKCPTISRAPRRPEDAAPRSKLSGAVGAQ